MSIKNFNTQPCPDCKRDTTHFMMRCRDCGHINESNFTAYKRVRATLFAHGKSHVLRRMHGVHAVEQRAAMTAVKLP